MKFNTSSSINICNTEEKITTKNRNKKAISKTNICSEQGSQQKRKKKKKGQPAALTKSSIMSNYRGLIYFPCYNVIKPLQ